MAHVTGGEVHPVRAWKGRIVSAFLVGILIVSALTVMVTIGTPGARAATPTFRALKLGIVNLNLVTFNPMKITLVDEYIVIFNVYSTLLTYDGSYTLKPDLASNWTVDTSGTVWTLHLVHDAYFTDPTNPTDRSHPVTSADVKYTYELQMNNTASILNPYTQQIQSVATPDPYTVVITTKVPYAAMYSTLTVIPIMPEYWWSAQPNPINSKPKYPIGSGVMYYDTSLSNLPTDFVLDRNPNYYGQTDYCQFSRPNQVWFQNFNDAGSMVSDFTSGASGLNGMMGLDPISYQSTTLTNFAPAVRMAVDEGFVGEFAINVMSSQIRSESQFKTGSNNPLLLNFTVRRAIAMSINKSYLVQDALLGLGHVADTLIPDTNPWHYSVPSSVAYPFDPAAARAMLYAAGWAYDSGGNPATSSTYPLYQYSSANHTAYWPLSFRFYTLNTEPYWAVAAADIVSWLHETGIQTTDRLGSPTPGYGTYSVNQMSSYWLSGDYDMWLWDWVFSPSSDPSTDIMEVETTMAIGPTSDNFYSNSTYDALYNESLTAIDHNQRQYIVNELQMMVYNYSSYILPYYQLELFAVRNDQPSSSSVGWTNWGNWETHVGLAPDSDLPNLWMNVYPTGQAPPTITSFPSRTSYTGVQVNFTVSASDPENDIASYSWTFGDGATDTTTTPYDTHTYTTAGNYTAGVTVSDGEWPACGSTKATIVQNPGGNVNLPPTVSLFEGNVSQTKVGMPVNFTLKASDPEGDSLYATWNWSDGTPNGISYIDGKTTNTAREQTMVKTHTFNAVGNYSVQVALTDNQTSPGLNHTQTESWKVTVTAASGGGGGGGGGGGTAAPPPPLNPLINYGVPLAIVAIIVVAVAVVMMRRRKQQRENKEDEEEPKQAPPSPPPPP